MCGPALLAVGLLAVLGFGACTTRSGTGSEAVQNGNRGSANGSIEVSPSDADSNSEDPCEQMFSNLFVRMASVSYNGYEIVRLQKTVYDHGIPIPESYAELRSSGRRVMTFEGTYLVAGNETNFGFASLLGGATKQLLVSQIVPRGGRHWVVDLTGESAVIFDSHDWVVAPEDVCVHDFDGDGVDELLLTSARLCGVGRMSMVECPLVSVEFKYDANARKYFPDRDFLARRLEGISEDAAEIDPDEETPGGVTGSYLARRLDILLRYVYGGREQEGWSFFKRTYNLPDKTAIEREIIAALAQDPVYKFVYRGNPR